IGCIVAACVAIGGPVVLVVHLSLEVEFGDVFVIDLCSVGCTGYQLGRDHPCQKIALHHFLFPTLIFLI
ncbi:hypothetical protein Q6333_29955, partial [Klebsiella pneumoniae]